MDLPLTPEQSKQLGVWAAQRDAILKVIADKTVERDGLIKSNKDLAASNTEISNKIQQGIGRLEEIGKREQERSSLIPKDIAALEAKKSVLQTEESALLADIKALEDKKSNLNKDIENGSKVLKTIFARAGEIEKVIGETVKINETNAREIVSILGDAKERLREVVELGDKNVEKTNKVINDLPKIVVDLHRDVVERRRKPRQMPSNPQI